jgi:hypothetical protein
VGVGSVDAVVVADGLAEAEVLETGVVEAADAPVVEAADSPPGASPSHATSMNAAASSTAGSTEHLRIG